MSEVSRAGDAAIASDVQVPRVGRIESDRVHVGVQPRPSLVAVEVLAGLLLVWG